MINELVTNAVEHGLDGRAGTVRLTAKRYVKENASEMLRVVVADDGVGLPETPLEEGLGLQIIRTLVTSELDGTIRWEPAAGGGVKVIIDLPLYSAEL